MRARSYQASPGPAKANVLCISLWMISVNMLVSNWVAAERRGCGKVDNRWDADLMRVVGPPAVHRRCEIPTAGLWSLLLRRGHAVDLPFFRMKDDRPGTAILGYLACSKPGSRR